MSRIADALFALAITLWVGALWAIGYISAPVLFEYAGNRLLAGQLAGHQFVVVAWLGLVCGVYALVYLLLREGLKVLHSATFWLIVAMLVLALVGHFGVTPIIETLRVQLARDMVEGLTRSRFATWHGVASVLWLVQSILGAALVMRVVRR
ncbi:MAG: DUF4149 domain-containing protein [Candidatus Dactylopiibacterium sp.]|nr:DUF4149 domain-containing protein [Candidatus Dactylopiibacterium sp.]